MTNLSERQWVTIGLFGFALVLLIMAVHNPVLWDNDRFNAILQAVVLTGILNMVAAFHFSGNQSNAQATSNTGKAFDALTAVAQSAGQTTNTVENADTVNQGTK